ncbi:MAG: hypothetical protein JST30_13670 [Armatimonadetes bacterium]|nr:hypothetical protein [Armatimonadota bacterium]
MLAALLLSTVQNQEDLPMLGTNLAGVQDWSTQWPFLDAFKTARAWISQKDGAEWGKGGPLEVGPDGNVKRLAPGQFAETVLFSNGKNPKGTYTLLWDGKGEFDTHLGSTYKLDSAGRATIENPGDKALFLMLKKVDEDDPPRNVRLMMPGYEDWIEESPFHPVFLQRMSPYRSLRFMDWQATNDAKGRTSWSDRAKTSLATYTGPGGVPLETMIDLANAKAAIPWFCVPHEADDPYVEGMATLIKDRLRPDLKIIVEYSNECWNGIFPQALWCVEQGKKASLADDDRTAGLRYYSQRSCEVFAAFEKVFGGRQRLVRVLSAQFAVPSTGREVLSWKDAGRKADAIAVGAYFGYGEGDPARSDDVKSKGLDGLFQRLTAEIEGPYTSNADEYAKLALNFRIRLLAYEGGQHLAGLGPAQDDAALNTLFDDANRSPKMEATYLQALKRWRKSGGSLFMHFTDCAPNSKYGRWGSLEYQDQDPQTSFKHRGLIQFGLFPDR